MEGVAHFDITTRVISFTCYTSTIWVIIKKHICKKILHCPFLSRSFQLQCMSVWHRCYIDIIKCKPWKKSWKYTTNHRHAIQALALMTVIVVTVTLRKQHWLIDCLLFNVKWAIFYLYTWPEKFAINHSCKKKCGDRMGIWMYALIATT